MLFVSSNLPSLLVARPFSPAAASLPLSLSKTHKVPDGFARLRQFRADTIFASPYASHHPVQAFVRSSYQEVRQRSIDMRAHSDPFHNQRRKTTGAVCGKPKTSIKEIDAMTFANSRGRDGQVRGLRRANLVRGCERRLAR